jgi:hypothetical protein
MIIPEKYKKAFRIVAGLMAIVKYGYTLAVERDQVFVVDPREIPGLKERQTARAIYPSSGLMIHREKRAGRSWSDMVVSIVENMGPVLESDKSRGLTTPELRAAHDGCDDPDCVVHGGCENAEEVEEQTPPDLPGVKRGWGLNDTPEA